MSSAAEHLAKHRAMCAWADVVAVRKDSDTPGFGGGFTPSMPKVFMPYNGPLSAGEVGAGGRTGPDAGSSPGGTGPGVSGGDKPEGVW